MSLEQALNDNTAALKAHTAVLSAFGNKSGTVPAFIAKEVAAAEAKVADAKPAAKAETKPAAKAPAEKKPSAKDAAAEAEEAYAPVKAITLRLHKEKGRPVAEQLLSEFGLEKSAKELMERPDEYEAYITRAEELLAEEEVA